MIDQKRIHGQPQHQLPQPERTFQHGHPTVIQSSSIAPAFWAASSLPNDWTTLTSDSAVRLNIVIGRGSFGRPLRRRDVHSAPAAVRR